MGSELLRAVSRFALIGVIGGLTAGCSGEIKRFADNPFQNPFSSGSEPGQTGSIEPKRVTAAPRGTVRSEPLAAPTASAPKPAPIESAGRVGGWSSEGGTLMTIKKGDTLSSVADRYSVPSSAILATNNISAAQFAPGQRIIIPVFSTGPRPAKTAAPSTPAVHAPAPAPVASAPPAVQGMNPSEARVVSTAKLATAPKPVAPKVVAAVPEQPKPRIRPGQAHEKLAALKPAETRKPSYYDPKTTGTVEPKVDPKAEAKKAAAKAAEAKPVHAAAAKPEPVKPSKPEPVKQAKLEAPKPVAVAQPKAAPAPAPEPAKPASKEPETTAAVAAAPAAPSADFRWPARGRVITGFGGQGSNEGVNIAVPEGTAVKAAEGGTVAYAGSEVKGYGNLVLIRHDNGYVSAYAHNGEIDVKRGQRVSRGQTIAKSGQSGNVTSPQLHFEIRKGSTPVDPMKYLAN